MKLSLLRRGTDHRHHYCYNPFHPVERVQPDSSCLSIQYCSDPKHPDRRIAGDDDDAHLIGAAGGDGEDAGDDLHVQLHR